MPEIGAQAMTGESSDQAERRIAEIKARVEAATAGPWLPAIGTDGVSSASAQVTEVQIGGGHFDIVARTDAQSLSGRVRHDVAEQEANAVFIGRAREDIPWLLARIEALEGALVDSIAGGLDMLADANHYRDGMLFLLEEAGARAKLGRETGDESMENDGHALVTIARNMRAMTRPRGQEGPCCWAPERHAFLPDNVHERLTAAKAQVVALEARLAELNSSRDHLAETWAGQQISLIQRATTAEAERDRLREAARGLLAEADPDENGIPADNPKPRDYLALRAALSSVPDLQRGGSGE